MFLIQGGLCWWTWSIIFSVNFNGAKTCSNLNKKRLFFFFGWQANEDHCLKALKAVSFLAQKGQSRQFFTYPGEGNIKKIGTWHRSKLKTTFLYTSHWNIWCLNMHRIKPVNFIYPAWGWHNRHHLPFCWIPSSEFCCFLAWMCSLVSLFFHNQGAFVLHLHVPAHSSRTYCFFLLDLLLHIFCS